MPILGTIASSYLQATTSYFSIASETLSSTKNTITFNNIPADYSHLQLRLCSKHSIGNINFRINADTGNNYRYTFTYASSSSIVSAGSGGKINLGYFGYMASTTYPFVAVADFLDYKNANKFKTIRTHNGTNSGQFIMETANIWYNTNAITRIDIFPQAGQSDFFVGSSFALYGIKG